MTHSKPDIFTTAEPCAERELILCVDHAEARIMYKAGYKCITHAKLRRGISDILRTNSDNSAEVAIDAILRLDGISNSADPKQWAIWCKFFNQHSQVIKAFDSIPIIKTRLRDPEKPIILADNNIWQCLRTTVLVGKDTFQLVRVADTYAGFDCYRHKGRMDEPFMPETDRMSLITADELKLLRFNDNDLPEIILTYELEEMTGKEGTPHLIWPTSIRAICGEYPSIHIVTAPYLVAGRCGKPFFLGLTRGCGYETQAKTDSKSTGALDYCIQTDQIPKKHEYKIVIWHGGDDIRQLVRYGGLTIFIGGGKRRKVQLRSLGLMRSTTAAGTAIYDLNDNAEILKSWAVSLKFEKPTPSMKKRNRSRVRPKKRDPNTGGGNIYNKISPCGIKVTLEARRRRAVKLRNMKVALAVERCGVSSVHLNSLGEGNTYYLNGRAKKNGKQIIISQKRCMIRCPRWEVATDKRKDMLVWLMESPNVVMSGFEDTGWIFAIVKVANGTEDQQREAVSRWSEEAGRRFSHDTGGSSWQEETIKIDSTTAIGAIINTNWRADALETSCYERYQTDGDYGKPLKMNCRGTATLFERARAYVNKVGLIDEEGSRNTQFSSALLNICDKFGIEAAREVVSDLSAKCTLPEKEKCKVASGILCRFEQREKGEKELE